MKTKLLWVIQISVIIIVSGFNPTKFFASVSSTSNNPPDVNSISPNLLILPGPNNQIETSVTTHPADPGVIAATAVTDVYPGGYTTGFYKTTNGGLNWSGTNSIRNTQGNIITTLGDPMISILSNSTFVLTYNVLPQGFTNYKAAGSYSTNSGMNWSDPVLIPGVGISDKLSSASDNSTLSPYNGRVYAVYSDYSKMGIYISHSSDGGQTWDSVKRVSPVFSDPRVGAYLEIGKYGELYVTWPFYNSETGSCFIGFAKSSDGGSTWESSDTKILVYIERLGFKLYVNNTRLNGLPVIKIDNSGSENDGNLYIVCSEKTGPGSPSTDLQDILIHKSTDGGTSWMQPKKVNQDNTGSLSFQYFPALTIDDFGGVNVVYFDTRNTSTNDSCELFLSRSLDGGNAFQDFLISDSKFKPKYLNPNFYQVPGYIGSYIGVTSSGRSITPVWYDNSNETYKAWTSTINFGIDVKVIPQGYYNPVTGRLRMKDTIKAYLRDSFSPYVITDSAIGIIDSVSFMAGLVFTKAVSGNYFIEVSHRNSINVWSKNIVNYSTVSSLFYDFTATPQTSFGNNQVKQDNKFCMYSGDVNVDGRIDIQDIYDIYGSISDFTNNDYPYSDVTGDGQVDLYDLNFTFNNSIHFVSIVTP